MTGCVQSAFYEVSPVPLQKTTIDTNLVPYAFRNFLLDDVCHYLTDLKLEGLPQMGLHFVLEGPLHVLHAILLPLMLLVGLVLHRLNLPEPCEFNFRVN